MNFDVRALLQQLGYGPDVFQFILMRTPVPPPPRGDTPSAIDNEEDPPRDELEAKYFRLRAVVDEGCSYLSFVLPTLRRAHSAGLPCSREGVDSYVFALALNGLALRIFALQEVIRYKFEYDWDERSPQLAATADAVRGFKEALAALLQPPLTKGNPVSPNPSRLEVLHFDLEFSQSEAQILEEFGWSKARLQGMIDLLLELFPLMESVNRLLGEMIDRAMAVHLWCLGQLTQPPGTPTAEGFDEALAERKRSLAKLMRDIETIDRFVSSLAPIFEPISLSLEQDFQAAVARLTSQQISPTSITEGGRSAITRTLESRRIHISLMLAHTRWLSEKKQELEIHAALSLAQSRWKAYLRGDAADVAEFDQGMSHRLATDLASHRKSVLSEAVGLAAETQRFPQQLADSRLPQGLPQIALIHRAFDTASTNCAQRAMVFALTAVLDWLELRFTIEGDKQVQQRIWQGWDELTNASASAHERIYAAGRFDNWGELSSDDYELIESSPVPPGCDQKEYRERLELQFAATCALTNSFLSLRAVLDQLLNVIEENDSEELGKYDATALEELLEAANGVKLATNGMAEVATIFVRVLSGLGLNELAEAVAGMLYNNQT
jgi:hypothetical protein